MRSKWWICRAWPEESGSSIKTTRTTTLTCLCLCIAELISITSSYFSHGQTNSQRNKSTSNLYLLEINFTGTQSNRTGPTPLIDLPDKSEALFSNDELSQYLQMLDEMQRIFEISNDVIINIRIVFLFTCDLEEQETKSMENLKKMAPKIQNISEITNQIEQAFKNKSHYVECLKKVNPVPRVDVFVYKDQEKDESRSLNLVQETQGQRKCC